MRVTVLIFNDDELNDLKAWAEAVGFGEKPVEAQSKFTTTGGAIKR